MMFKVNLTELDKCLDRAIEINGMMIKLKQRPMEKEIDLMSKLLQAKIILSKIREEGFY